LGTTAKEFCAGTKTDRLEKAAASVYFAGPLCVWQGAAPIENTNGLLRQYFPKGADFSTMTVESVS